MSAETAAQLFEVTRPTPIASSHFEADIADDGLGCARAFRFAMAFNVFLGLLAACGWALFRYLH